MNGGFVAQARFAIHSLWLCMFPILSVTAAVIVLTQVSQGKEVLRAAFNRPSGEFFDTILRLCFVLGAMGAWSLANWYSSRILLERQFSSDPLDPPGKFPGWWRKWFPRAIAVIGLLLIAYLGRPSPLWGDGMTATARHDRWISFFIVLLAIAVAVFVVERRRIFPSSGGAEDAVGALGEGDKIALWFTLGFSIALTYALSTGNYGTSRFMGAPSILFIALGCATLFGSIILIYLPKASGGPALTALPLVLFLSFAQFGWNHNHVLSERAQAGALPPPEWRPDAFELFQRWDKERGGRGPIVLVAAEGGASRSAWWTSHVLGAADYASGGEFSRNIFAISGVSGGSVGAASFAALVARRASAAASGTTQVQPRFPNSDACLAGAFVAPGAPLPVQSACFLGRDFLAPTLGYMLFPDSLQRFLPWRDGDWDRSWGLELTWQIDWAGMFGPSALSRPLPEMYLVPGEPMQASWRTDVPQLILNTAGADSGRLIMQSSMQLADSVGDSVEDLQRLWPAAANLPMASWMHNSARFPVVSPGGEIYKLENGKKVFVDSLVDGGYFENSGAHSLLKLVEAIERGDPKAWPAVRDRIVVLFIQNDPPARGAQLVDGCYKREVAAKPIAQEELLTAIYGLYQARTARGEAARTALMAFLNKGAQTSRPGIEIPLESDDIRLNPPSMNWYMTAQSRHRMWDSLKVDSCSGKRLGQAFTRADAGKAAAWSTKLKDLVP